jgi:asparagine synthase (glutamine-hydrolysing)
MGFIFGIVNFDGTEVNTHDLRTLSDSVKWKGFNDRTETGKWYGLGYCWYPGRSPGAEIYANGNLVVICNARIYNTVELRKEIDFDTAGEAFANAYWKWGISFAGKFNGDFSAVILDRETRQIFLLRDHIGGRPLCYAFVKNRLLFASHEFGIAKSGLIPNAISEETLIRGFFRHKRQNYHQTAFLGIKRVVPGRVFSVSSGKVKVVRYWFPEEIKRNKKLSYKETILRIRQLLIESTTVRIEEGMTGVHVSGGIDSSGIAAIVADQIDDKKRLTGYSWSPEKQEGEAEGMNEKELIDDFAIQKGIPVKYLTWDENRRIGDFILPEFENMPIEMQTMEQAKRDGVKTIFSGWGGDEFVSLSLRGILNHIVLRFKLIDLIRWVRHFGIKDTVARAIKEILPLFVPFGLLETSALKRNGLHYFTSTFIMKHWKLFFFNRRGSVFGFDGRTRLMLNHLKNHHLAQRMDSWALFGEKYGLEYKYPLLDRKLLEFWFSVPIKHTYKSMTPRFLYREAMKGILPEMIRTREGKGESILQNYTKQRKQKIKDELAKHPELFSGNEFLPFFRIKEFKKLTINQPEDRRKFNHQMFDLNYFLRYKHLCEKYLANPDSRQD